MNPVQHAASVKNSSCLSNWPLSEIYLPTIQLTAVVEWSGGHGSKADRGPDYDEQARDAWRRAAPEGWWGLGLQNEAALVPQVPRARLAVDK